MAHNSFMDTIRSFLGLRPNFPRNDFRNPIWSSDDEDDGDELYSRQQIDILEDKVDVHEEFRKQMNDMMNQFGSMFGEFKSLFHEDNVDAFTSMTIPDNSDGEQFSGNNIRDYYLKPGYHTHADENSKQDSDLDGKISSNDISGLLKRNEEPYEAGSMVPFNGNLVPGRSFCQTIITTSIKKPDGSIETRKIIKNGSEIIDEITTTSRPDGHGPALDQISSSGFIYNNIMSELSSFFRNYH